jgi:tetratricopeptide (TPR) repeat protein
MTSKSAKKSSAKKAAAPRGRTPITEKSMGKVKKALEGKNFATLQDLNRFLGTLAGPGAFDAPFDTELSDKEEAQELAFDAMEAESSADARRLAKRALALDPDCVDALVVLTGLDAHSPREAIEGLQRAVAAGERSLGAEFIRKNRGYFWGILETRPWMRAMEQLAGVLRSQEIYLDAIRIYERMLELNPNDNQGVRDSLLGVYLAAGDAAAAGKLLKKYRNDGSANFAWGRVLERYLDGDLDGASRALVEARAANGHVELYLMGRKPIPKALPEMYSMGSEEEAIFCMDNLAAAWADHTDALLWVAEQCTAATADGKPTKALREKRSAARPRVQ